MIDLTGKNALITGVTRRQGIGAAIARHLAEAGANIATAYWRPYDEQMTWGVTPSEPETILADLRQLGRTAIGFEIDLADPAGPDRLLTEVRKQFNQIDILVNNATYSTNNNVDTLTAAELDRHYAVNLRGTALLTTAFARQFDKSSGGRVINITSGQGLHPMPEELAYAATKAAADALAISLSPSLAQRGITINVIDPGATDTGWMTAELQQELEAAAPMGRLSTPDDTARLVTFLASDAAEWLTGQIIHSRGAT